MFEYTKLKNDDRRGWVSLRAGCRLRYAFIEWSNDAEEWVLVELSWLTNINADFTMKSCKRVTANELANLSDFIKTLPPPNSKGGMRKMSNDQHEGAENALPPLACSGSDLPPDTPRTDAHGNLLKEGCPGLCFGECSPENCWVYACGPKSSPPGA